MLISSSSVNRGCLVGMQIEAAYDVLFMQSMKKRITGELEVSSSVKYADVPTRKRSGQVRLVGSWMRVVPTSFNG